MLSCHCILVLDAGLLHLTTCVYVTVIATTAGRMHTAASTLYGASVGHSFQIFSGLLQILSGAHVQHPPCRFGVALYVKCLCIDAHLAYAILGM